MELKFEGKGIIEEVGICVKDNRHFRPKWESPESLVGSENDSKGRKEDIAKKGLRRKNYYLLTVSHLG